MTGPEIVLAKVAAWRARLEDESLSHTQVFGLTRQELTIVCGWLEHAAKSGSGVWRIAQERRTHAGRGWTAEHDDQHGGGELASAAAAYAVSVAHAVAIDGEEELDQLISTLWPWNIADWQLGADPVRRLEKAGALIAAEIDRLLRQRRPPLEGA